MTTAADIANRALVAMGARSTLANFALEQTPEAKQLRLLYDPTRDALLRAAHWSFARKMFPLSLLKAQPGLPGSTATPGAWNPATMPAPPWGYEYLYPADCIAVRYVTTTPVSSGGAGNLFSVAAYDSPVRAGIVPAHYAVATDTDTLGNEMTVILTDVQSALVCYTARVQVEDRWDASFQQAMVYALASQLALSISGNLQTAQTNARQAMETLQQARSRDGNEGTVTVNRTPDWIVARGYGNGGPFPTAPSVTGWIDPAFLIF